MPVISILFSALQANREQPQLPVEYFSKGSEPGVDAAVEAASMGVSPWFILAAAALALIAGFVLGLAAQRLADRFSKQKNKPKWPRDWPKNRDIFSDNPDPTKPGYMSLSPVQAMGSGAMPLGRTYPRWNIFPDMFPFREWRRRVQYLTSKPVWVQYTKRFQHFSVLGATGKGKSTSFAIPILAYGALEKNSAYFAIDVKSPAFVRMFADLYKSAGKDVVFFDPWSLDETLGFEPLWRANDEQKDILADVISSYSAEAKEMSSSENSEFFKVAATRLMRGLIELAQFWPRRYCNLPCLQQLIAAGGNALKEAFEKAEALFPSLDETIAAAERVLETSDEELRTQQRSDVLTGALAVLDRSGYRVAFVVRRMRLYQKQHVQGKFDQDKLKEVEQVFWSQLKHEWLKRKERLDAMMMQQGEFINQPEDTRNSVVSTLTNKVSWFRDPNVAKAFSRDELQIRTLIQRPCLFLIGAPMAKLKVGSLFVASIISNLAINAVFQRGMAIERRQKGVSKHGIFFMLDEFPQLQIKSAPSILATFRGFVSGLLMVFQERGQLKQLYGEDAVTMEGNTVHKVLLQGSHEDTAEFYAQKAIGETQILKRSKSGVSGEKQSVSESLESMPLMTTQDVKSMKLNGRVQPQMALSIGADVPAFPLRPTPFYEDPTLRKLLHLKRDLRKEGYDGRPTWKFWQWSERWEPTADSGIYMSRRKQLMPQERDSGKQDPVFERAADPYTQYLDYLVGRPRGAFDELTEPRLKLPDIAVTDNAPGTGATGGAAGGLGAAMGGPPAGAKGSGAATVPSPTMVPVYGADFRILINEDFKEPEDILDIEAIGGSLADRLERREGDEDTNR